MSQRKKAIVCVSNDLCTDQRVHKMTLFLEDYYDTTLVGRKRSNSLECKRTYETLRLQLFFNSGPLFYADLNIRLFIFMLISKVDLIFANDLDTLPAAFLVSKIKRIPLIFDSHELFSEVPEVQNRPFVQSIWRSLENWMIPHIKYGITVCESIRDYYQKNYGTTFTVIRNVPFLNKIPSIEAPNLRVNYKQVLIYQGSLNVGRGIELMIDAMEFLPKAKLIIIGEGDIRSQLEHRANLKKWREQIQFLGRIPLEELSAYTKQADIGLSLEENQGLNYTYALPNKVFDYIHANLTVVVSDLPEMKDLVTHYQVGLIFEDKTPKELANTIKKAFQLKPQLESTIRKAKKELNWELESQKLNSLIQSL